MLADDEASAGTSAATTAPVALDLGFGVAFGVAFFGGAFVTRDFFTVFETGVATLAVDFFGPMIFAELRRRVEEDPQL